jgi:hypothetical protein
VRSPDLNAARTKRGIVVKRRPIDLVERLLQIGNFLYLRLSFLPLQRILAKSILGPRPTSVDVVSPGGQTISVSVEGVPPSTIPDVVCPLAKGVTNPAVSVPDASPLPLTNPDSAASAGRNLEVL